MKQTPDTLRTWYLNDLQKPDIHHGRTTPKARNLHPWKQIPLNSQGNLTYTGTESYNVWGWSDIHFGHKNIIRYTNRPFGDVSEMNEALIENFHDTVKSENDIVIWNGDIGFMPEPKINEILDRLPGYFIHVYGNHDIHRDGTLYKLKMDESHLCFIIDVEEPGKPFFQLLFTHYPLDSVPPNCVNVHGHIHDNLANEWNINISVEHTNYRPLSLKTIIERARNYLETGTQNGSET